MFFNKKDLKTLLREEDGISSEDKKLFLKQYTANYLKISEISKFSHKEYPTLRKHIKFLLNSNKKDLTTLYEFYKIADQENRDSIKESLLKIEKYRTSVNLSLTIGKLNYILSY